MMQKEERNKGAVSSKFYMRYFRDGGGRWTAVFVFFLYLIYNVFMLGGSLWVAYWSGDPTYQRHSRTFYLLMYAGFAFALAGVTYIRSITMATIGFHASKNMHRRLLVSILTCPSAFFDTNPIGRIISRFSGDLKQIDTMLPGTFEMFLFCITFVFFTMVSVTTVTPLFGIALVPIGTVYISVINFFRAANREFKRLQSISRSPVYAHFSETLGGLSTIRAYGRSNHFVQQNQAKVDTNVSAHYVMKCGDRWLSTRLEILGSFIALIASMLAVHSASSGALAAGLAGFSLSFAMSVTGLLQWSVRTYAELEGMMNSVERVVHYSDDVEQETTAVIEDELDASAKKLRPPENWPDKGSITFDNVQMRYRENTPLVLKGMDFTINGGEKVGVVGRTGAGKSSIMLTIFRIMELDNPTEGSIDIDGIKIAGMPLPYLRSRLSIIPQEPVLFSGTVRSNLDPFDKYGDDDVWAALEKVDLKEVIESLPLKLDAPVSEYGENFSLGQRQLFCLARVLLKKTKLLLLDEATSSVDVETDELIQKTIRSQFSDVTILTIAHRINTIIDSDRILCIDDGRVAEFDTPHNLLQDPESIFASLVDEQGPNASAALRKIAKEKHQQAADIVE